MELTSLELNNTIVQLRKVVGQAKYRVTTKLTRRLRAIKKKRTADNEEKWKKKFGSKCERYLEDVMALKKLKPDDVSKFALLNTKTLQELKIKGTTTAPDRVLYKVAAHEVVVSAIEEFREKYPEWHREVPFMLQRLGLQYKFRKGERDAGDIKKLLNKMKLGDAADDEDKKSDSAADDGKEMAKPEGSLLEKVKSRRKEEKLARKKNLAKRLKEKMAKTGKMEKVKAKAKKSAESGKKSQRSGQKSESGLVSEGRSGEMEIRRLDSDSEEKSDSFSPPTSSVKDDPFFIGGTVGNESKERKGKSREPAKQKRLAVKEPKEKMITRKRSALTEEHDSESRPQRSPRKIGQNGFSPKNKESTSTAKEENLHPSWQAKRQQRILQKNITSAPTGKKIKFD